METSIWDKISSIGQMLGALATFLAVIVALRQNKPKVTIASFTKIGNSRISHTNGHTSCYEIECTIKVTNIGIIPITIQIVGLLIPRKKKIYFRSGDKLPMFIAPGQSVQCSYIYKSVTEVFSYYGYCVDSANRTYFLKENLFKRLYRFLWWRFGKEIKELRE